MRVPFLNNVVLDWISGCHDGGWVVSSLVGPLIRLVNLFSGAVVELSEKQRSIICPSENHDHRWQVSPRKTVCSESPTSGDCILASKTLGCGIALCRVGCPEGGWTIQGCPQKDLADIAFCNGELYGLRYGGTIVRFEIGVNEHGAPVVAAVHQLAIESLACAGFFSAFGCCIFDLHGKLGMALRTYWSPGLEPFFKVFQLVDEIHAGGPKSDYEQRWLELTSLGEDALFLGDRCSKVVHVPANTLGGVERNCIYYTCNYFSSSKHVFPRDTVFFTISNGSCRPTYYHKYDVAGDA
jgi:hypothetical protein